MELESTLKLESMNISVTKASQELFNRFIQEHVKQLKVCSFYCMTKHLHKNRAVEQLAKQKFIKHNHNHNYWPS